MDFGLQRREDASTSMDFGFKKFPPVHGELITQTELRSPFCVPVHRKVSRREGYYELSHHPHFLTVET